MKYYLREMLGSFVRFRLIALADDKQPPEEQEPNEEAEILAHMWQAPDTDFSRLMGVTDFSQYCILGPERTGSGYLMGGHHLGGHVEITQGEALELLEKAKKENGDCHGMPSC